jgi:hypothetical protein
MEAGEPADFGILFRLSIRYSDEIDRCSTELQRLEAQGGGFTAEIAQLKSIRDVIRAEFEKTQSEIVRLAADQEQNPSFVLIGIAITADDYTYWSALLQVNIRALQALERKRVRRGDACHRATQIALRERRVRVAELQQMLSRHSASPQSGAAGIASDFA